MPKNRKAAEAVCLKWINEIAPGGDNANIYKGLFAAMTDKDFDSYIQDLTTGKKFLVIIAPNFGKVKLTTENNLRIAKELGHDFFQKLWIEGKEDMPTYLTPIKYLVLPLPIRRASQMLTKKTSVPDHMKVVNALTGQPTGESQGAKISYPELQIAAAMGLDKTMVELMKYRGGDIRGGAALTAMLSKLGKANLSTLSQFASGVESTRLLKSFLTSAMLRSTL